MVRLPRPIVNKKRISPPEISITKKPAQPEITAPPDRQTPEAAYVSQTTPAAQKTTKVIGITKISKQRMQTIQLAEDQSNKPPVQQRSMKANSVKSSQTKQQDDSLSTGSFRAYSPVQSSAKNQPGQQGHVKVQTYAKTFRDPPGKTNRLRTSPKTFQSTQKHADNSPGMSWLPSLEAEAVSMIKPPGSAGYSTFASAVTRRFNTQEKVAHHSMAQDRTRDVRRIVDKKHVPKKTASTNAPPPPAPESTKHSPEPLQLSSNIQSDRDDTAESRSAIAYQDSCNGIGTQSALSSSNEAEKVRGDTQPSVEERSEGFRSANSNFNTSALHESEAENDDLDLVRSSAHPIYTGIMDPFSDDILSMLSSAIVLQGVADQFSDDIVYYPSRGDSQNKPRYPNAGHKDAFLNAQRQQQNMEDPLQQRTGMQPMGAQCIDLAARNPATLSGQGGSQNRYLHVFNNVPHRTTNTHHEHEAPPITKDNLYKRTRDDYKGSVQGPQYPPVAPPVAGIRNEYEHDASQSLRTEYHKLQGSMDYQDVYFVDPWAQHVARQNATVHHPADSFTQTLRRYPPPKKQTYPGDSALERGMEQTLQQPRQGEFHPQYSGRTYQDLFTMRSHAPHPGTESNPAQSSHKQYAPVDVQHQGETPFTKTNIHFKDPQRLLAAHTIPSQFCGLQIQEQPRQHSMAVDSRDTFAPRSDVPKTHYKVKGDFANAPRVLLQSSPEVQGYENTNRGQMRCDNQDSRAAACIPEWHSGPHRIPTGSLLKPPRPSGDAPI